MVSAEQKIWLVGTQTLKAGRTRCRIESLRPSTLQYKLFSIPGCGPNVVVGDGEVYTTEIDYPKETNNQQLRIERFDTATGRVTVMAPIVMTLAGSDIAHTAMTFGDGSIWLWGYGSSSGRLPEQDEVVQISPVNGAVIRTYSGVPAIGGAEPSMVFAGDSLWMAAGPGGSEKLETLSPANPGPAVVYTATANTNVQWVTTNGSQVFMETSAPGQGKNGSVHLVTMNAETHQVVATDPLPSFDLAATVSGRYLWAVGSSVVDGNSCSDPLALWSTNTVSGTTNEGRSLISPCVGYDSALAISGHTIFVLVAGSLSPSRLVSIQVVA